VKAFFDVGLKGVRDVREAKKTELQIDKLEAEERERDSVIEKVTLADVQKYDPKQAELDEWLTDKRAGTHARMRRPSRSVWKTPLFFGVVLIVVSTMALVWFLLFR